MLDRFDEINNKIIPIARDRKEVSKKLPEILEREPNMFGLKWNLEIFDTIVRAFIYGYLSKK